MIDYTKLAGDERKRTLDNELARLNMAVTGGTLDRKTYEDAFANVRSLTVENDDFAGKNPDPSPAAKAVDDKPSIPTQGANLSTSPPTQPQIP